MMQTAKAFSEALAARLRPVRLLAPLQERRGAAAVEFALVATPFLFLLFAVAELGLIFVANICLSNATLALARGIRVGSIVAPGMAATSSVGIQMDLADFKAAICKQMQLVPTSACLSQLQLDVRTQASFQNRAAPSPFSGSSFSNSGFCFYSGAPGSIVELRAYYLWPLQTPVLLSPLVNATSVTTASGTARGSYFVLTSSEVFKSEPNATATNTGSGC